MEEAVPNESASERERWESRRRYWKRKLGRLRLGVEPLDDQLARYRRVTWLLTAIPLAMGLFIVALFTAFKRPDVGVVFASVLFLPIIAIAWIDFGLMAWRASCYEREMGGHDPFGPPR